MSERVLRVGLLGCGTVGSAVARLLHEHRDDIARRAGCQLEITAVAVRDPGRPRDVPLGREVFFADPMAVIDDPDVDIVCELIGGNEPAGSLIMAAFDREKPVVTANKELLANRGRELFDASDAKGLDLYFEAAVGGGIPLIRPLKESLTGERLSKVLGIVNGTTNFILTRMTEERSAYPDALAEAQRLGYAEADPAADIEGDDAAAKCAILASIAFNARVVAGDVYREGIANVTPEDIEYARRLGYVVKLLAISELGGEDGRDQGDDERIAARVHPAMIPATHPLASVRDAHNAVFVQGPNVGELMFYGPGAGGDATATAVVGDLVSVARNLSAGARGVGCTCFLERTIRPMEEMTGQYYILLRVEDRPGALAEIADVFGRAEVSIKSVWQEGFGDDAQLVFITHRAREGAFQSAVTALRDLPVVEEVRSVLRVEAEE
jgi:homoserine dehydrogenase